MVSQVSVYNKTNKDVPVSFTKKIAEHLLLFLRNSSIVKDEALISLTIVYLTPEQIRKYNKDYRNTPVPTDVLSFPSSTDIPVGGHDRLQGASLLDLGDVLVCLEEVEKNAISFGEEKGLELARVIAHGILHLVGYDHKRPLGQSKEKIYVLQENFLESLKDKGIYNEGNNWTWK